MLKIDSREVFNLINRINQASALTLKISLAVELENRLRLFRQTLQVESMRQSHQNALKALRKIEDGGF